MKFTFRKRSFLNPTSTGFTSFILAEAESSDNGAYEWGNYYSPLPTVGASSALNSDKATNANAAAHLPRSTC